MYPEIQTLITLVGILTLVLIVGAVVALWERLRG